MLTTFKRSIFFLLGAAIAMSSCSKNFINDVKPTDAANATQVFADAASVRVYFNGIYSSLRSTWQSVESLGSGNTLNPVAGGQTDTWGYNSLNLTRVAKGKDIVMPYASWYIYDYQNDNREPTYRRVKFVWYFLYEEINQLNTLIDGVTRSTTIAGADKPKLIAEARALRGFLHFELAREFQLTLLKDPNAPGVPYYSQPASLTNNEGKGRGTMRQLFDSIDNDMAFALANLTADRNSASEVNLNVAEGMAARIYLEEGKWSKADSAAQKAIEGQALDASGYRNNYNGLTSPEIIWGFPQTTENGGQSVYYGTPSSFYDQTGEGYDAFFMSSELVGHFSNSDIRNTFYVYDPDPTAADYLATNKFGKGSGSGVELITGEQVELKVTDFNESLNMMRVAEMYLISAEARARQNNNTGAGDVLFELQSDRDPAATPSGNTGSALIDEILLERRKELYGELGIDWLDAKRLQQPIDRTGSNHPVPYDYVIPANDPRFNLKIPQSEIQSNPNINPGDQNP